MSKNIVNTTIRFNLKNPEDRRAWEHLREADHSLPQYRSQSKTIVTALNDHFTPKCQEGENEASLQNVSQAFLNQMEDMIQKAFDRNLQGQRRETIMDRLTSQSVSEDRSMVDENLALLEENLEFF